MSWNNPVKQREKTLEEKFWEKVNIVGESVCWEWKASKNKKGYGNFYISIGNSKDRHCLAHRMAWMLWFGEIPDKLNVLHKCDNPSCCNPYHLFLGTNQDNVDDKVKKGRLPNYKGENHPINKLKNEDIINIRKMRKQGMTLNAIAKNFNVDMSTIGKICRYSSWGHIE